MGVDIGGILEKTEISLDSLEGKRIAIDAYNTIYQFLTIIRQPDGTPLQDSHGHVTSHLSGLFYRTCNLLERGISVVYVFDGQPSDLKKATLEARSAAKKEAERRMIEAREAGRIEEAAMLAQRTVRLTPEIASECKHLLSLMGVPWLQAPSEGEAQCAHLCLSGLAYAVGSQDYDALLFGAPKLVRNITIAGRRKVARRNTFTDVVPEEIDLKSNLDRLQLDRRKLIWLSLLVGTDFNKGIYGIGPKKALKLVTECATLEEIVGKLAEKAAGFDVGPVQELFEHPPVTEVTRSQVELTRPKREELVKFLADEHDFSGDRINSSIAKAFSEPLDSQQSSLSGWFK